MTDRASDPAVVALIEAFDDAFAACDAERCADLFAADGRLCLLHSEERIGQEQVRKAFRSMFERLDTSDWNARTELMEIRGDHAYAYRTYTERLRIRADDSRQLVRGRLALLLGRADQAGWRIRLLMNSHSHRPEPIT